MKNAKQTRAIKEITEEILPEQFVRGLAMIRQGAMPARCNEMREIRRYAEGNRKETNLLYEALFEACEAHEEHIAKQLREIAQLRKTNAQLLQANVRLAQLAQAKRAG